MNRQELKNAICWFLNLIEGMDDLWNTQDIQVIDGTLYINDRAKETLDTLHDLEVLEQSISNYKAELKANLHMLLNGKVREYDDNDYLIKCVWDKDDKTRFDQTAFKNDYPELAAQYTKTETCKGYVNIYHKKDGELV